MPSAYTKAQMSNFMQESDIIEHLQEMLQDESFITEPGYSIDSEQYPDNKVPFVEDHIGYLKRHRQVDPSHYLSNLRIMLKIR